MSFTGSNQSAVSLGARFSNGGQSQHVLVERSREEIRTCENERASQKSDDIGCDRRSADIVNDEA
ncbi:MAG: hypothetical protein IIB38_13365 [Candidatus Hydrogenedentes bacterium]|nr:hypothetical protein [Candidatus Hydrogenedentota bacterium]